MIKFELKPQRPALLKNYDNELHVLAKLIAPTAPPNLSKRKNLNLSIVLDRSGSMSGAPLEEAKRCASMMVESLGRNDRISIVTYDDRSNLLVPSVLVKSKREILSAITTIRPGGMTDLFGGWSVGAEQVGNYKSKDFINRVLLLSDGNANTGICEKGIIEQKCIEAADKGISTSTYGLGRHFNEDLMMAMSKSGQGQGYYGDTADDLEDPFREEFELLVNTIATNLEINIEYPEFINVKLLNSYLGQDPKWKLPNLAYEAETWALFKLNIRKEKLSDCKGIDIFKSHILYIDLNGRKQKTPVEKIRLEPINENAFGALVEDEEIRSRILEVHAAILQRRAREAANEGDWAEVEAILSKAKDEAADNAWIQGSLSALENYARRRETEAFSKEALYASDKFESRLQSSEESFAFYDTVEELNKKMYLRRKMERGKKM